MVSVRTFSLFLVLFVTWLLLSGIWDPFLIASGAVASLLVVVLAYRMDMVDSEGHPIQLTWRLFLFLPWLAGQIARSNLAVTKIVFSSLSKLNAGAGMVPASQKTTVGLVSFANSITLTPGTVSLSVYPDEIYVHALDRSGLEELRGGEMDRRVCAIEGKA